MTKSELVRKLAAANPRLYPHDVEVIITLIFDQIAAALARGDRIELHGFGAFSVKHRGAHIGRTRAPASIISRAVSASIPRAAPEIRATLPSRRFIGVLPGGLVNQDHDWRYVFSWQQVPA
jgi:integration host factor subunit beta